MSFTPRTARLVAAYAGEHFLCAIHRLLHCFPLSLVPCSELELLEARCAVVRAELAAEQAEAAHDARRLPSGGVTVRVVARGSRSSRDELPSDAVGAVSSTESRRRRSRTISFDFKKAEAEDEQASGATARRASAAASTSGGDVGVVSSTGSRGRRSRTVSFDVKQAEAEDEKAGAAAARHASEAVDKQAGGAVGAISSTGSRRRRSRTASFDLFSFDFKKAEAEDKQAGGAAARRASGAASVSSDDVHGADDKARRVSDDPSTPLSRVGPRFASPQDVASSTVEEGDEEAAAKEERAGDSAARRASTAVCGDGSDGDGGGGNNGDLGDGVAAKDDPKYAKFFKMLSMGVHRDAVELKMKAEGLSDASILDDPNAVVASNSGGHDKNIGGGANGSSGDSNGDGGGSAASTILAADHDISGGGGGAAAMFAELRARRSGRGGGMARPTAFGSGARALFANRDARARWLTATAADEGRS